MLLKISNYQEGLSFLRFHLIIHFNSLSYNRITEKLTCNTCSEDLSLNIENEHLKRELINLKMSSLVMDGNITFHMGRNFRNGY